MDTKPGEFKFIDFKTVMRVLGHKPEWKDKAIIWGMALKQNQMNEDLAMEAILRDPVKTGKMIGTGGRVGARASSVSIEFKNGAIVPKAAAAASAQ